MNPQNNQGSGSSTPLDPPLKRKRGRPRKDETQQQVEAMSSLPGASDHMRRNIPPFGPSVPVGSSQVVADQAAAGINMIGQPVSGIIDGKFDAGYLLKVKVGDSDTYLRGVAFIPDRVVPITASNDVAPQARMYTRTEVPIPHPPLAQRQPQVQGSVPSMSQQGEKQYAPQSSAAAQQFTSVTLPLTDKFPAASSMGPSAGVKMISQQVSDSGVASIPIQSASGVGEKHDDLLLQFDASTRRATNETRPVGPPAAATTFGVLPASGTVNLELQIQHQAEVLKASQSTSGSATDGGKITSLELVQPPPPVISEPGQRGIISSQSMDISLANPTAPAKAAPTELSSAATPKVVTITGDTLPLPPNGAAAAAAAGGLVSNVTEIPVPDAVAKPDSEGSSAALQKILESQFGSSSSAPMEIFEKETAAAAPTPVEPELGNDGNVPPKVSEPQFGNAPPSESMDCDNVKDAAIPPTTMES